MFLMIQKYDFNNSTCSSEATNAFLFGFFPLRTDELKISKAVSNFSTYSDVSLADAGKCPSEINVLITEATEKDLSSIFHFHSLKIIGVYVCILSQFKH